MAQKLRQMKELEKIKNGELALKHNGTTEQLNKALKICFPEDTEEATGKVNYYYAYNPGQWGSLLLTKLPTIKVTDFLNLYKPDFPRMMMVRNKDYEPWRKVEVLHADTEYYYTKSLRADSVLVGYKYARPIKVEEISKKLVKELFNCDEFKIVDK